MVKTRLSFLWWQPNANSNAFANGCVKLSHSGTPSDADILNHLPVNHSFSFARGKTCEQRYALS
jgi:hypothetical protein